MEEGIIKGYYSSCREHQNGSSVVVVGVDGISLREKTASGLNKVRERS